MTKFALNTFIQEDDCPFYKEEASIQGWCPVPLMQLLASAVGNFCDDNKTYLEIGSFCGRSLAAALKINNVKAIVIDPLNLITGNGTTETLWNQTVDKFHLRDRITLFKDFAENFVGQLPPIGVFFYDGNHDSGHTYEALNKFSHYLASRAIIIIDDYNIHGGNQQEVYPGHTLDIQYPVKTDTERWIKENKDKIKDVFYTTWLNGQAIILYEA